MTGSSKPGIDFRELLGGAKQHQFRLNSSLSC